MENHKKLFTVLESDGNAIPKTLESTIKYIEKHVENVNENHLIFGVIYTLMLECGYSLSSSISPTTGTDESGAISDDDSRNYDKVLGRELIHETIYFSYQNVLSQSDLPNHILTSNEKIYRVPFRLLGVAEYSFILLVARTRTGISVVNLGVLEDKTIIDCYAVAFKAASFISMIKSADVASKFNNLRYFSILFKNRIALKGRSLVLNKYKLLNNSLEGMPVEILLKIIKYLTIDDQEKVASLSSTLYSKTSSFLSSD